jgi:feruloyl esterase
MAELSVKQQADASMEIGDDAMTFRHPIEAALLAAASTLPLGAAAASPFAIESTIFPTDPNSVTVAVSAPTAALAQRSVLTLNGVDVSSLLVEVPGTSQRTGTIPGLVSGDNVLVFTHQKTAPLSSETRHIFVIGAADCNLSKLGTNIDPALIGEPVSGVTLSSAAWTNATATNQAFCRVNGSMSPIDPAAPSINFGVTLPNRWTYRYAQMGGGGNDGSVPGLAGASYNNVGMATAGSDSGHQLGSNNFALNDESVRNFGYMQMKKTHDAAVVLQQRAYGAPPKVSYWFGSSQGGREGITVAQRYPADFDGISIDSPVLAFSSLTLSRAWSRIQEKPLANWVTTVKVKAIVKEIMRQCDGLDGLLDGVINNYMACRAVFDVTKGAPNRQPWAALRCPGNVDPNPADSSADACLTDGQISTLQFTYSPYKFATPIANGVTEFGMYWPGTDVSGNNLMVSTRFKGQEGASPTAPVFSWLGGPWVVGSLFKDLSANALDYVEGGVLNDRRIELSGWIDSTMPDLSAFKNHGGKLISWMGTNDTLGSPGAMIAYYQSVLNTMGQDAVDSFARLWVIGMMNHVSGGSAYSLNGAGEPNTPFAIPTSIDNQNILVDWVEKGRAPGKATIATAGTRTMPVCSYPAYPAYVGGPTTDFHSYQCVSN